MKLTTVAVLSLAALTGTALQAKACNPLLNKNYGKHVAPTVIPAAMLARNQPNVAQSTAIVGLWHDVRTASDGSMFMEGFDTWYADGNENELANFLPATGAYCTGHWTKHGKTAELTTHVAFLYDTSNNFIGTINISQKTRLSEDGNSYIGKFDAKFYDPSGNQFQEVTGTANGERLVQ